MANHRHSKGKDYYQPNKYKANLMHQRAMRAGDEPKPPAPKNTSDRFLSSRRDDQINPKPVPAKKPDVYRRNLSVNEDNFDIADNDFFDINTKKSAYEPISSHSAKPQPKVEESAPANRYSAGRFKDEPKFDSKKIATIAVGSLLVLAVIAFVIWCIIDSANRNSAGITQDTTPVTQPVTVPETQPTTAMQEQFATSNVTDDNSDGEYENGYYIWGDSVYDTFTVNEYSAANYAEAISRYSLELGNDIKTYAMIIPSHIEIGLPARLVEEGDVETDSQADFIDSAYKQLSANVTAINCYNALSNHCNEYIYYTTENYWTALGAYYGYTEFTDATSQTALDLTTCTENKIDEFYGLLTREVSAELPADTVSYYDLPYDTTNDVYYESDGEPEELSVYYEAAEGGKLTYGVFLWGDNPLCVLKSNNGNGKKIAVVKDSNGNCFVPYLTYNYDEVHVIDYMLYEGNVKEYCDENGITEVMFINGAKTANSERHISAMNTLFTSFSME